MNRLAIVSIAMLTAIRPVPAAADVNEDVRLCRAALGADPIAAGYTARFERYKDGRVRVVRFTLTPSAGEAERLKAYCTVEKSAVTGLEFRPD